jgi:hypothetical protein
MILQQGDHLCPTAVGRKAGNSSIGKLILGIIHPIKDFLGHQGNASMLRLTRFQLGLSHTTRAICHENGKGFNIRKTFDKHGCSFGVSTPGIWGTHHYFPRAASSFRLNREKLSGVNE